MSGYLLDSNHASALVTLQHPTRARVIQSASTGDTFYVTLLVVTETVFGFGSLPRAVQNAQEWTAIRPMLRIAGMNEQDAHTAANLRLSLRRRGRQLALVDALIAVAALRFGLVLLTTDGDFAHVSGLRTESWMPRRSP